MAKSFLLTTSFAFFSSLIVWLEAAPAYPTLEHGVKQQTALHNVKSPCEAEFYLGDIALTEEDALRVRGQHRHHHRQTNNSVLFYKNGKAARKAFRRARRRSRRAATAMADRLWDSGVIPYQIDEKFSSELILMILSLLIKFCFSQPQGFIQTGNASLGEANLPYICA